MKTTLRILERDEFIATMTREFPHIPVHIVADTCRKLMRAAATHGRLAEEHCNGHPAQSSPHMPAQQLNQLQNKWDARIEREQKRIEALITRHAESLGCKADFGGDPRGYTVKLILPSGRYNTWGKDGWGIPQ